MSRQLCEYSTLNKTCISAAVNSITMNKHNRSFIVFGFSLAFLSLSISLEMTKEQIIRPGKMWTASFPGHG